MKRKVVAIICAVAICASCVGIGFCANETILRRVYSNLPEKVKTTDYLVIERDIETGVDYMKFYNGKGELVDVELRRGADGKPFVASNRTAP